MTQATRPRITLNYTRPVQITTLGVERLDGHEWEVRSDGTMVRRGDRMYECVKPLTATYGSGRVAIALGERVIATHELLRRFPAHFHEGLSMRELVVRA